MRRPRPSKQELASSHLMRLANIREQVTPGEQFPRGVLSTLRVCKQAGVPISSMSMALGVSVSDILRELRRDDTV